MTRTTLWLFGVFIMTMTIGSSLGLNVGRTSSAHNDRAPTIDASHPMVYVKASIPMKIFRCITRLNILRCMQIFILQRMERSPLLKSDGNLTTDFLDHILAAEDTDNQNLWNSELASLSDTELNARLQKVFQAYFSNREIKLFFIPGIVVKVRPSLDSYLNFSIKKNKPEAISIETGRSKHGKDELDGNGKRKPNKHAEYAIQLGIPALMMPAILLGSVLPFILPTLKIATILSLLINKGALLTAAMHVAKNTAFDQDKLFYSQPSYHRDLSNM